MSKIPFDKTDNNTLPSPTMTATINPNPTTFAIVLVVRFSFSTLVCKTFKPLRSTLVAIKICAKEKTTPIKIQSKPLRVSKLVTAIRTVPERMIDAVLTIEQNKTFAPKILFAEIGNVFCLRSDTPSRVMFVAQKVFVNTLKTNTINKASSKLSFIPSMFWMRASNKVKQQ